MIKARQNAKYKTIQNVDIINLSNRIVRGEKENVIINKRNLAFIFIIQAIDQVSN